MNGLVKEVQEREVSAPSLPPSLPKSGANGFPSIGHRSQRISAFKRSRQEGQSTSKASFAPNVIRNGPPPVVAGGSSSLAPKAVQPALNDDAKALDVHSILQSVQAENEATIGGMSESEKQREVEELEGQMGKGLMGILRARASKKRAEQERLLEEQEERAVVPNDKDNEAEGYHLGTEEDAQGEKMANESGELGRETARY